MGIKNVIKPLVHKQSLLKGVIGGLVTGVVYVFVAFLLVFFTSPRPSEGYTLDYALFSFVKSIYQFPMVDLVLFTGIVLSAVLLFANYNYWKCSSENVGKVGLLAGIFALSCPACLLPLLGVASIATFALQVGYVIKIGALILILGGTYFVANRKIKCNAK